MPTSLIRLDWKLFHYINGVWHTPWLDSLLTLVRNPFVWAPLYLFLAAFTLINFRWRGALWSLFFLITFGITDSLSARVIKPLVGRIRPCFNPLIAPKDRLLIACYGKLSFPSSHAMNHFGLGVFLFVTGYQLMGKWRYLALGWAFIISYSQVYVGVHFPGDILGGALIGSGIGWVTGGLFNRISGLGDPGRLNPAGSGN